MTLIPVESNSCAPEDCDTFQFMSKRLGITVLHPGGLDATKILADRCGVSEDMTLLDAGCGSGSSSLFLARRYGCKVIGIDIDQALLLKGHQKAWKSNLQNKVAFRHADLHDLPFPDQFFDGVIVQATLIFTEKPATLRAIHDAIRPDGFVGAIELAWKTDPPAAVVNSVRNVLCSAASSAEHHATWIERFNDARFNVVAAELRDLDFSFREVLKNEGVFSSLRVTWNWLKARDVRTRTNAITRLFKETHNYLGYGLYVGRKR